MTFRLPATAMILLSGSLLLAGCASSGMDPGGRDTSGGSSRSLSGEQLVETRTDNLLDAIRRLRPQWLRARGAQRSPNRAPVQVMVYVDEVRFGPVRSLARIRPENVASVEFVSATDATTRWGLDVAGGVISVYRR